MFLQEWNRFDLIAGRYVELHHEKDIRSKGMARGIDKQGALLIENNGSIDSYHFGEVSVRLA